MEEVAARQVVGLLLVVNWVNHESRFPVVYWGGLGFFFFGLPSIRLKILEVSSRISCLRADRRVWRSGSEMDSS